MATKQTRLTPFGRKVRKRLIDKNMTQVELAALLGCNKQYVEFFESRDFVQTIGVCQACQEYMGLGIIVGKSGQGKTHALKKYAELQEPHL